MRSLALLLIVAACSAPPSASNVASADVAPSGEVGIVAPAGGGATPSPAPVATPTVAATEFPAAFRGRWGMTPNDCDPARADNKGLILVSADDIRFYESRATIGKLTVAAPTRVLADLAFSGEGQTWKSRTVLDLSEDGTVLTRSEESPAASYRYTKCAA